jgi:hypothetical protein
MQLLGIMKEKLALQMLYMFLKQDMNKKRKLASMTRVMCGNMQFEAKQRLII